MVIIMILGLVLLLMFGLIVLAGPPFVRTHKQPVHAALDLLNIGKGSHLLDLGSGDGAVLLAVALRGAKATGYELNPIMWLISKWRTRKYSELVKIHWGDMWQAPINDQTENIFVFLDSRFMKRLDKKVSSSKCNVKVASYSFKIPGKKVLKTEQGVHLYKYSD